MKNLSSLVNLLFVDISDSNKNSVFITTQTMDREKNNMIVESKTEFSALLDDLQSQYLSKDAPIDQINQVYDILSHMQIQIQKKMDVIQNIHSSIDPEVNPDDVQTPIEQSESTLDEPAYVHASLKDLSENITQLSDNSYLVSTYQEGDEVFLPLPNKVMEQLSLKEGDELSFTQHDDGSIILQKKV